MNISLVNDIRNTSSPNGVNERGRKLCPITMNIVTHNNSVIIDGVIYTTKGFALWVKKELETDYNRLTNICNISEQVHNEKQLFVKYIRIRSPMNNTYYGLSTISTIYKIFVDKYYKYPLTCVYDFIHDL